MSGSHHKNRASSARHRTRVSSANRQKRATNAEKVLPKKENDKSLAKNELKKDVSFAKNKTKENSPKEVKPQTAASKNASEMAEEAAVSSIIGNLENISLAKDALATKKTIVVKDAAPQREEKKATNEKTEKVTSNKANTPSTKESSTREPVAKEPSTKEPSVKESVANEPSAKEPVANEPAKKLGKEPVMSEKKSVILEKKSTAPEKESVTFKKQPATTPERKTTPPVAKKEIVVTEKKESVTIKQEPARTPELADPQEVISFATRKFQPKITVQAKLQKTDQKSSVNHPKTSEKSQTTNIDNPVHPIKVVSLKDLPHSKKQPTHIEPTYSIKTIPVQEVSPDKKHQIRAEQALDLTRQRRTSTPARVLPQTKPQQAAENREETIRKAVFSANAHVNARSRRDRRNRRLKGERLGWQRIVLALSCASILVFAIAYFVNLSAPDVSLKVAAMQTGIDASYPTYTPRDFSLTDITSEDGKITLNFKNTNTNTAYTLTEEKSSWDSNTLYNNYVKLYYDDDYVTIREQGLTIYIDGQDAVWVNGGIFYNIHISTGTLTKKQITTIATSL